MYGVCVIINAENGSITGYQLHLYVIYFSVEVGGSSILELLDYLLYISCHISVYRQFS